MKKSEMLEKNFSIVQEISSASVVADNISTIANLILDLVVNYTDAEKGSLMLLNDRGELSAIAVRGIDPHLVRTYRAKLGEGIAGTVALNRQAVLVEDIEKDERFRKSRDRYSTRSFMSCPIMSKNRLLGVLNVNDKKDGTAFTEDEFSLIKVIADQAALALENNALMNRLRAQAAELDEINKKLMDSDALKTESITHISHELRTPLNPIKGAVYYLQSNENLSHAERMEFYTIISTETDKLISIVENLLDYLRLEDETRIIRKSVVDLGDLLEGISGSKLLKLLLSKKNLSLETRISPDLSDIVGDKMRVEQLFLNLLEGLSPYLESEDRLALSAAEN
ncbi:MAG: GAF domain-containing protein, partial [Nitrospirota bacterium]